MVVDVKVVEVLGVRVGAELGPSRLAHELVARFFMQMAGVDNLMNPGGG